MSLFSNDLAIDLGTANSLVFCKGRGFVVSEPSIVAVNRKTGRVEAVGREAKNMLGRTPGNIVSIRPMKDGVIADFEVTERMLEHFIRKAHGRRMWVHPRIVIGVPSEKWGETVKAIVVDAPGAAASDEELIAYCRDNLAHFKCPRSIDRIAALPRNPSGKILKTELREPFWKGHARRVN